MEPGLAFPHEAAGVTQKAMRKNSEKFFITYSPMTLSFSGVYVYLKVFSGASVSLLTNIPMINLLPGSEESPRLPHFSSNTFKEWIPKLTCG